MNKYEVVMAVVVEASSLKGAIARARLAGKLAHEHLRGEWKSEAPLVLDVVELTEAPSTQQELPL